jgi:hypothetical protein
VYGLLHMRILADCVGDSDNESNCSNGDDKALSRIDGGMYDVGGFSNINHGPTSLVIGGMTGIEV